MAAHEASRGCTPQMLSGRHAGLLVYNINVIYSTPAGNTVVRFL
jgi:hypothetical protein